MPENFKTCHFLAAILAVLLINSCNAPRVALRPNSFSPGFYEQGVASWYGHPFHGCPTAAGEIYDMYKLTAAHKELPLGTRVLVTNLENRRTVTVVVNDRGPFVKKRIIDLSLAAARKIDMENNGTARVRLDILELPADVKHDPGLPFAIQFAAYAERQRAETLKESISRSNPAVYIETLRNDQGALYRVRLGWFAERRLAQEEARRLGFPEALIFRR